MRDQLFLLSDLGVLQQHVVFRFLLKRKDRYECGRWYLRVWIRLVTPPRFPSRHLETPKIFMSLPCTIDTASRNIPCHFCTDRFYPSLLAYPCTTCDTLPEHLSVSLPFDAAKTKNQGDSHIARRKGPNDRTSSCNAMWSWRSSPKCSSVICNRALTSVAVFGFGAKAAKDSSRKEDLKEN